MFFLAFLKEKCFSWCRNSNFHTGRKLLQLERASVSTKCTLCVKEWLLCIHSAPEYCREHTCFAVIILYINMVMVYKGHSDLVGLSTPSSMTFPISNSTYLLIHKIKTTYLNIYITELWHDHSCSIIKIFFVS